MNKCESHSDIEFQISIKEFLSYTFTTSSFYTTNERAR